MTTEDELLHVGDRSQVITHEHGTGSAYTAEVTSRDDDAADAYLFAHAMSIDYSQEQAAAMVPEINAMPPVEVVPLCREAWGEEWAVRASDDADT